MLRITIHDKPEALTFQLEGRLAGPWVRVLQECWQDAGARHRERPLYVDLTEVTPSTPPGGFAFRVCTARESSSLPPTV